MANKITPFLWFDHEAEDAARFYVKVFGRSKILAVTRYGPAGPGPQGSVMTVAFQLEGQRFTALNGGPVYKISPAISLVVHCKNQAELNRLWKRLCAGGREVACGWLEDRFGVSWQLVPAILPRLLDAKHPERAQRVMAEVLKMKRLDIGRLERAARGG